MLTFANPLFLYAGIALFAPVLIHLMKKQIAAKLNFPTIRFLTIGKLPNDGRRKLRDILLLLIRLLIIAFIVLFFAKPEWQKVKDKNLINKKNTIETEAVILLDLSASMNGWDNFKNAKNKINKIVKNKEISKLGLIGFSGITPNSHTLTDDKNKILSFVDNLKPSLLAGNFSTNILKEANKLFSPKSKKQIYIVSDFQVNDWKNANFAKLEKTEIHLIDTSNANANIAIINAETNRFLNNKISVKTTLRNYGLAPKKCTVTLNAGNKKTSQDVIIPALSVHETTLALEKISTRYGTISIGDDEYNLDNNYSLWLGPKAPTKILIVSDLKDKMKSQELYFIKKAFSAISKHSKSDFSVTELDYKNLNTAELADFDGIIFIGADDYSELSNLIIRTKDFLKKSGPVLFTPGNQPAKLFFELKRNKLLDANFVRTEKFTRRNSSGIKWINPKSSLGKLYKDSNNPDIFLFPVYKYIDVNAGSDATVLMKFDSSSPALLTQRNLNGALYATTFAFSTDWSDFQISSSFLPTLNEIFSDKQLSKNKKIKTISCGEYFNLISAKPANKIDINPTVKIINNIPHEINVSRKESVIEKQSLSVIRRAFQDNEIISSQTENIDKEKNIPLSQWCILLAILFVILEFTLSQFFDKELYKK